MADETQNSNPVTPVQNPAPTDPVPNLAPPGLAPAADPPTGPAAPAAVNPPSAPAAPSAPGGTVDPIATAPPPAAAGGVQMPQPTAATVSYGGFWIRWLASILDGFVSFIVAVVIFVPLAIILGSAFGANKTAENIYMVIGYLILIPVFLLYYVGMLVKYGATLGKKAVGLRVVDENGNKLTLGRALLREIVGKFVSGLVFDLGYLWAAFDEKKQGWHDKIANTYVVKIR